MYAHKLIEGVNKYWLKIADNTTPYVKFLKETRDLVIHSHKFHIDFADDLINLFPSRLNKPLFMDMSEYLKVPYGVVWLDFNVKKRELSFYKKDQVYVNTRGILVIKINETFLKIMLCYKFPGWEQWGVVPVMLYISIGTLFNERDDIDIESESAKGVNIYYEYFEGVLSSEQVKTVVEEFSYDIWVLECFLCLLNCKNIKKEKTQAPAKLNKKRKRTNKMEIFSYYTLKIKLHNTSKKHTNYTSIDHNRIHFCRGHFKEYTEENPLFGKYTGLYWWQPHVRGQNRDGIVLKDYQLETA